MVMRLHDERVWAGTESSLKAAMNAEESISKQMAAGHNGQPTQGNGPNEDEVPRLLQVSDGIAVITIKGSLNNDEGFWNEIYGMTGYPEIRKALLAAVNDESVKQILLDIDSGGGAVSGVSDTGNLIRLINDHVKPVTTFTDGTMASAAYWLGCSAGEVCSGRTAVVGSIGVISTHKEYSKMYAEAGIGVTVIRAGKYKALANSVEPLSADGKKQIQQVVDAAYEVFVEHVANMRGHAYDYADQTMAQGQEFVGEAGVKCGLTDSITTFDTLMGELSAKVIDASNKFMENRGKPKNLLTGQTGTNLSGETEMSKQALTEQAIAAIASGATAQAVAAVVTDPAIADALTGDTAAAAAVTTGDTGAAAAAAGAVETVAQKSAVLAEADNLSATVQLLKEQVSAKDEQLIQAGVKISKLEEDKAATAAVLDPLLALACKSAANLQVALGGSAMDMSTMTPSAIVAEHSRLAEQFASKFKAGGVAAVSADQASNTKPQVPPRHMAQVAAAGFHKK